MVDENDEEEEKKEEEKVEEIKKEEKPKNVKKLEKIQEEIVNAGRVKIPRIKPIKKWVTIKSRELNSEKISPNAPIKIVVEK